MTTFATGVPALIPLALLEAMRNLDTPIDDGLAELDAELVSKRLGLSSTVASQIERYRAAYEKGTPLGLEESVSVYRLVGRRADADLVFADAGRRAARHAARQVPGWRRTVQGLVPGGLRTRLGRGAAAHAAAHAFAAELQPHDGHMDVRLTDSLAVRAGLEGLGCAFYGAAFAELLRVLADLEHAITHETCQARGDAACSWRAATVETWV